MKFNIGQNLKRLRNEADLTLQQVSERIGWSGTSRLSQYETGKREPTLDDIQRIATAINCTAHEIIFGSPDKNKPGSQIRLPDQRNDVSLVEKALAIALSAYAGKTDKAGQPYILHPLRVMAKMNCDEEAMAAAVLHDVIEDSDIGADDLRQMGMPDGVVSAVQCLSRGNGESYPDFIERVKQNPFAAAIKLADIEDNLNVLRLGTLTDADLRRVAKYHQAWHCLRPAN